MSGRSLRVLKLTLFIPGNMSLTQTQDDINAVNTGQSPEPRRSKLRSKWPHLLVQLNYAIRSISRGKDAVWYFWQALMGQSQCRVLRFQSKAMPTSREYYTQTNKGRSQSLVHRCVSSVQPWLWTILKDNGEEKSSQQNFGWRISYWFCVKREVSLGQNIY